MEVTSTELLARHVYCPASVLFMLSNFKNAAFFPELSSTPFLIHVTSGSGFPEASQAMVRGDPSMKYFPPKERLISGASERQKRLYHFSYGVANFT